MLNAVVISNDIHGLHHMFCDNPMVRYRFEPIKKEFSLNLDGIDVLIVPNGCDHIALLGVKDAVHAFLDEGGALLCFDGWFTDWIPGNRWIHDNTKATRDIRYFVKQDRYSLFDGVNLDDLQFNHGISGWWACGYIKAAAAADLLLVDTWQRPVIVLDESSTNGLIILTASGPLSDKTFEHEENGLSVLYKNMLRLIAGKKIRIHEFT